MHLRAVCTSLLTMWALAVAMPCGAQPRPDSCEQILEAYAQVETLYASAHYEEAADLLRATRLLCPTEPLLAYNLARALDRRSQQLFGAGDAALGVARAGEAVEAYDAYLASPGEGPADAIARAQERRGILAEDLVAREAARREAAELLRVVPSCSGELSPGPWITVGVSLLGLAAGVGLSVHAVGVREAADQEPVHREALGRFAEAEEWATAANATFAPAGFLFVGGLVWGIVDAALASAPRPCEAATDVARAPEWTLSVGVDGASVSVRF